jgi:hypothetical protein
MPANYTLIEKITVGAAGASSVTFSGIPQTGYTDLVVKFAARGDAGAISRSIALTFNGSATSYSSRYLQGDGSAASSGTGGSTNIYAGECTASTATASTFANQELYIPNYASSNYKSVSVDSVAETNATTQYMGLQAGLWSNTAAITSIGLAPGTGNFAQYSTFYLYGVAKLGTTPAIVPYATGGDTIMTDGTYWYHAFLSSGTFTPAKGLSCDYLVVAGGGGSGNSSNAGGGGAGGLRSTVTATGGGGSLETAKSFASGTAYTITIGGGGGISTNGSNSSIAGTGLTTITSTGGGYGGNGGAGSAGNTGGSGGGVYNFPAFSAGSGTANQGFAGGGAIPGPPNYYAGGGGGAGAVGTVPNGGNGVQITAFATPTGTGANSGYYAGGGAGAADAGTRGTGGLGGGGTGGLPQATGSSAGVANTGGGGGAYANSGGSGIVIVRYLV